MLSHRAWPHRLSPSTTAILTRTTTTLAHAQSEESGIEPGQIATITGSYVSFGQEVLEQYDTDHTDLGSDTDENEVRRGLLRDVSVNFGYKRWFLSTSSIAISRKRGEIKRLIHLNFECARPFKI